MLAFKFFSIFSFDGHIVYSSGTIFAIFIGSHLGNISVKSESQSDQCLGGDSI